MQINLEKYQSQDFTYSNYNLQGKGSEHIGSGQA